MKKEKEEKEERYSSPERTAKLASKVEDWTEGKLCLSWEKTAAPLLKARLAIKEEPETEMGEETTLWVLAKRAPPFKAWFPWNSVLLMLADELLCCFVSIQIAPPSSPASFPVKLLFSTVSWHPEQWIAPPFVSTLLSIGWVEVWLSSLIGRRNRKREKEKRKEKNYRRRRNSQ